MSAIPRCACPIQLVLLVQALVWGVRRLADDMPSRVCAVRGGAHLQQSTNVGSTSSTQKSVASTAHAHQRKLYAHAPQKARSAASFNAIFVTFQKIVFPKILAGSSFRRSGLCPSEPGNQIKAALAKALKVACMSRRTGSQLLARCRSTSQAPARPPGLNRSPTGLRAVQRA